MNTKLKSTLTWFARIPRNLAIPILFIALVFVGTLALILGFFCAIIVETMERLDPDGTERDSYKYPDGGSK